MNSRRRRLRRRQSFTCFIAFIDLCYFTVCNVIMMITFREEMCKRVWENKIHETESKRRENARRNIKYMIKIYSEAQSLINLM